MDATSYCFGRFVLQPAQRLLLDAGKPVRLGGRAFDLLLTLVERRERVVSRSELFECVWPARVVEDDNLKAQVMALRKVLGAAAIATVPGRGYRFTLEVKEGSGGAPAASGQPWVVVPVVQADAGDPCQGLLRLFGRAQDAQGLRSVLAQQRLVTLVGPGGIGKTVLARHVAATLREAYADGVGFVELASLTDASQLPARVARTLGFAPGGEAVSAQGLAKSWQALTMLIVLDNCEHLIGAAAAFAAALVAHAPRVTVLATSQEPLRVSGEHVWRLAPLALPVPGETDSAAVRLFLARWQDPRGQGAPGEAGLRAAAEICQRLDGIPLALELAAASAATLGVEEVRRRLDDRFRLLTRGARDAPARQQTLLGVLSWSHDLLSPGERTVFRRLAVFTGSFDLQLAEGVASDDLVDGWTFVDHLAALVEKSLVVTEDAGDGEGAPRLRYRLLETTRAFAKEQLVLAGESDPVHRRLALALVERLRAADDDSLTTPAFAWVQAAQRDAEHRRAALAWARARAGDEALAIGLFAHAGAYWHLSGAAAEGAALHRSLGAALQAVADPVLRARHLLTVARLATMYVIDPSEGEAAAREAAQSFRSMGDRRRACVALYLASGMCERNGNAESLPILIEEMRALEEADWPPTLRLQRRWAQARLLLLDGRLVEHRDAMSREVRLCTEAGDERTAWLAAHSVALAELNLGRIHEALTVLDDVVERIRRRGMQRRFPYQIAMRALALIAADAREQALDATREALALLRTEGAVWWLGDALGRLAALRGDWSAAARLQGWALARVAERGDRRGRVMQSQADRLARELATRLSATELVELQAAGAHLDDAGVVALALGEARIETLSSSR